VIADCDQASCPVPSRSSVVPLSCHPHPARTRALTLSQVGQGVGTYGSGWGWECVLQHCLIFDNLQLRVPFYQNEVDLVIVVSVKDVLPGLLDQYFTT
jgi:hypothetical protein